MNIGFLLNIRNDLLFIFTKEEFLFCFLKTSPIIGHLCCTSFLSSALDVTAVKICSGTLPLAETVRPACVTASSVVISSSLYVSSPLYNFPPMSSFFV